MKYYHVSENKYKSGQIIDATTFKANYYSQTKMESGLGWIEDVLEFHRPKGYPSRTKCVFAFDDIGKCFLINKYEPKKLHYYEIEMNDPINCPMCLVDEVRKENHLRNEKVSKEYWNPQISWNFQEYLSTKVKVITETKPPSFMDKIRGQNNYDLDYEKKKKLFQE